MIRRAIRIANRLIHTPGFLFWALFDGGIKRVSLVAKCRLILRIRRITRSVVAATSFTEHLMITRHVLHDLPPGGILVECGCFKGASTCTLSILAKMTGRRLIVFDSFRGLPDPSDEDQRHMLDSTAEIHSYQAGTFAGSLQEVREHVRRFGEIDVCEFVPGFFDASMMPYMAERKPDIAFAFLDVDLCSSLRDCLKGIWPRLLEGGVIYTHEAPHREIAGCFHDRRWWKTELATDPPGLVGGGCGLLFDQTRRTGLGYAVKSSPNSYQLVPQLGPGESPKTQLPRHASAK